MKTFASIVAAFIAALFYAFVLGYTQDSAHPIVAAIQAAEQNIAVAFCVSVMTFAVVQMVFAFRRGGRYHYLFAPNTISHKGINYRSIESLRPGQGCKQVSVESRNIRIGWLKVNLTLDSGDTWCFLIPEQQVFGMEFSVAAVKDRETAGVESNVGSGNFYVFHSPALAKLLLIPKDWMNDREAHENRGFESLDRYVHRMVLERSAKGRLSAPDVVTPHPNCPVTNTRFVTLEEYKAQQRLPQMPFPAA